MVYGSAYIGSNFYLKAYLRAPERGKNVVLTFDDGVHIDITPKVLDILARYKAKATFFVIGKHIETPEAQAILRRMQAEGHGIGNHSYSHSTFFDFYGTRRIENELKLTHNLIARATGEPPRWFRPPYGVTTPHIGLAVRRMQYQTIGWSVRSLDTVVKSPEVLLGRVMKQVRGGDIILLHDHHAHILAFLPLLLEQLRGGGYEVGGLEEMMRGGGA